MTPEQVRRLVIEELRALLERALDDAPKAFSTHCDGPRPEGLALRAWQRLAPTIPGAVRRGRYVQVPREAFAAWEASRSVTPPIAANDAEPWSPAAALANAGLRVPR